LSTLKIIYAAITYESGSQCPVTDIANLGLVDAGMGIESQQRSWTKLVIRADHAGHHRRESSKLRLMFWSCPLKATNACQILERGRAERQSQEQQ